MSETNDNTQETGATPAPAPNTPPAGGVTPPLGDTEVENGNGDTGNTTDNPAETQTVNDGDPQGDENIFSADKLVLHEDLGVNDKLLADFTEYATSKNLSLEDAQGLVDMFSGSVVADRQAFVEQAETNRQAILSDPEIGGAKWKDSSANIIKASERLDPSGELTKILQEDAVIGGSLPLLKGLAKMGARLGETRTPQVGGNTVVNEDEKREADLDSHYGG